MIKCTNYYCSGGRTKYKLGCIRAKFNRILEENIMTNNSNCGCHKENGREQKTHSSCGCHEAQKTATNNQWASPASVKSEIESKCGCGNKNN